MDNVLNQTPTPTVNSAGFSMLTGRPRVKEQRLTPLFACEQNFFKEEIWEII